MRPLSASRDTRKARIALSWAQLLSAAAASPYAPPEFAAAGSVPGSASVVIADSVVSGNTASRFGGGLLVCGARVAVDDSGGPWGDNYVREFDARESQDVFLCAAAGVEPSGWEADASLLPWLDVSGARAAGLAQVVARFVVRTPLSPVNPVPYSVPSTSWSSQSPS